MAASARRIFLLVLVASLFVTGALAIAALLVGDFDDTEVQIILTTAAIAIASLLALPGGVLLDRNRLRPLAYGLFAAAAAALALALHPIWLEQDGPGQDDLKPFWVAVILTGTLSQTAAVLSRARRDDPRAVIVLVAGSMATAATLASLLLYAVFGGPESEAFARAVGAVAVANVVLVVVQPFLRRASGKEPTAYRLRVLAMRDEKRSEVERELRADDFAAAAEAAIRAVERDGSRALRVERISPATGSDA